MKIALTDLKGLLVWWENVMLFINRSEDFITISENWTQVSSNRGVRRSYKGAISNENTKHLLE